MLQIKWFLIIKSNQKHKLIYSIVIKSCLFERFALLQVKYDNWTP